MADLIDRDALMKKICGNECGSVCDEECENAFCNFYDYIMDAPAVNRWIPCKSYLPEQEDIVWVCLYWGKDAYVRKGYIKNGVWYTADGFQMIITPKFWMPEYIPEPPKGDQK